MTICARCDWNPNPADDLGPRLQLVEHATDSGHPLCVVCTRSLPIEDRQTCETCLTRSRQLLADIASMYAELPVYLGHVRSPRLDADRPGAADGRPLPGGDVLVLLGSGSEGLAEDGVTTKDGDAESVAFALNWWHERWQDARDERAADVRPSHPRALVAAAVGYLEVHSRWAAQHHDGFDDYADDLRLLHARLQRATGTADRPDKAEAECFTCGADALIRKVRDRTACGHRLPPFPPADVLPFGIRFTVQERRVIHDWQIEEWELKHGRCRQGGHEDQWTCARCGRVYEWQEYLLACRARVEQGREHLALVGWGTPRQVSAAVGVPVETVKTWAKRGLVGWACMVESQQQLVWYPDADDRARRNAQERARRDERRAG